MPNSTAATSTSCWRRCSKAWTRRRAEAAMRAPLLPGRIALGVLAGIPVAALVVGAMQGSLGAAWHFFLGAVAVAVAWAVIDLVRSIVAWRAAPLHWQRRLPTAWARG